MKEHFTRLERIAGELNAWLFAIAIGLAVLDFTVLVAKAMPPLPTGSATAVVNGSGQPVSQASSPGIVASRS